ncbi:MAG: CapA family protein [Planctomycetes bacterium]|nr:CapA family protein [Planctomycetota bacterium]
MSSTTDAPGDIHLTTLFLCGDVMTGRGIDQILPFAGDPHLYEPYVDDARCYRQLAEFAHGTVPAPVSEDYIWGDALEEWSVVQPDTRIVNLETAITASDSFWQGKEIHYRMSPRNVGCLKAAGIDCCTLANNHVLDWGYAGLAETLESLEQIGIKAAGAGRNQAEAEAPAVLQIGTRGRVLVFSYGLESSGIPVAWAAGEDRPGLNLLSNLSEAGVERIRRTIAEHRLDGDIVIASLHWGGNWGYSILHDERRFAQQLIERAKVDIVHGHSSHHVRGIEVYEDRLILYGCGDFLTDYEGVRGRERFRGDLALMYFASVESSSGRLVRLQMTPLQVHRMRLRRASATDAAWLRKVLDREGGPLGTQVTLVEDRSLQLQWT